MNVQPGISLWLPGCSGRKLRPSPGQSWLIQVRAALGEIWFRENQGSVLFYLTVVHGREFIPTTPGLP